MEIYLHFGNAQNPPMQTIRVEHKEQPLEWQKRGLTYTATGYGRKIPSRYMVKFDNKWRRVYSRCYSNISSEYVVIDGEEIRAQIYS